MPSCVDTLQGACQVGRCYEILAIYSDLARKRLYLLMDLYAFVKTLHIISAAILFGTGMGIAFFMLRSHFTSEKAQKYYAVKNTVLADYCFTLPAVIVQPLSGAWLVMQGGFNWQDIWLVWTYAIYFLAGICWVPVVLIQIRLKKMLQAALQTGAELPANYDRLFKLWFALGWPAFSGLIVVFYLMVAKPV